jgi:hypothetical protein
MKLRFALAASLVMTWLPGCVGTETGNPTVTAQFALNAHSSEPQVVALRAGDAPLVVQEVWLSLGAIDLREGENCADPSAQYSSELIGSADHAHPEPAYTEVALPEGSYQCVNTAIVPSESPLPDLAPADFYGKSILIRALLNGTTLVTVTTDAEFEVSIPALAGAYSLDSEQAAFLLGFDVAKWLAALDLASADLEQDGSLLVSPTNNESLYETFLSNVPLGLELYRDADGDGALDQDAELLGTGEGP